VCGTAPLEAGIVSRTAEGRRDEEGYYWFVGRSDDVIKSSGHLIGPFEVESVLMEHPAVAEAGVIGKPDPVAGEIVKAFVSLKHGNRPARSRAAASRFSKRRGHLLPGPACVERARSGLLEHERHLEVDPVVDDVAVLHFHLLALDPGAFDVLDGLGSLPDPCLDRGLEALRGFSADFDDLGDGHGFLLSRVPSVSFVSRCVRRWNAPRGGGAPPRGAGRLRKKETILKTRPCHAAGLSFAELRSVYELAWDKRLKGCATFRPNPVTGEVLAELRAAEGPHCCAIEREGD
jgi:hypothetical protein